MTAAQREALEAATRRFESALPGSPAEQHLKERGIPLDVAQKYRLGYVEDDIGEYLGAAGRLAIPFVSPGGVVAIRFRWLEGASGEDKKYWQPAGTAVHLFNVQKLHDTGDQIAITEGEIDALVLSELCGIPAVAIAGTNGWKPYFRHLFSDLEVIIAMDGDEPGRKAAEKLKKQLPDARVAHLPNDHDVNSLYLQEGAKGVRKALGVDDDE